MAAAKPPSSLTARRRRAAKQDNRLRAAPSCTLKRRMSRAQSIIRGSALLSLVLSLSALRFFFKRSTSRSAHRPRHNASLFNGFSLPSFLDFGQEGIRAQPLRALASQSRCGRYIRLVFRTSWSTSHTLSLADLHRSFNQPTTSRASCPVSTGSSVVASMCHSTTRVPMRAPRRSLL